MKTLTEKLLKTNLSDVFTDTDVINLLGDASPSRRYALVKRALASKEIIRIKRGLYMLATSFQKDKPDLFCLAGQIHSPSYIGLESALAAHGWIPERVLTVVSGSFKRSRNLRTPLGRFEYKKSPFKNYIGLSRVEIKPGRAYLLSSPLRALAEMNHEQKKSELNTDYLIQSLRIDPVFLTQLAARDFEDLLGQSRGTRINEFLRNLQKELGL